LLFHVARTYSAGSPAARRTICSPTGRGRDCRGLLALQLPCIPRGCWLGCSCPGRSGPRGGAAGSCNPCPAGMTGWPEASGGNLCYLPSSFPCGPPSSSWGGCCCRRTHLTSECSHHSCPKVLTPFLHQSAHTILAPKFLHHSYTNGLGPLSC
jgi:hypothetical protein